jgi:hypothetical protein
VIDSVPELTLHTTTNLRIIVEIVDAIINARVTLTLAMNNLYFFSPPSASLRSSGPLVA